MTHLTDQVRWRTAHPDYQRLYDNAHREERRAYNRAYRETHREERRAYQRAYVLAGHQRIAHLRYEYGLTLEQYDAMLEAQGGACAVCGATGTLVVDHDHASGSVRGLLCDSCNVGIGRLKDDPAVLALAVAYLTVPKGK
jgi:hypothetical protein